MNRAAVVAIAVALLASLALAPCASAKPDRKARKERAAKEAKESPAPKETAAEAAPATDNAALPAADNAALPSADNAALAGPVHETDITSTVVTGRPVAAAPEPSEGPSFFWAAVKMVLALGIVLAMLLGISHFMKKYMDRFGAGGSAPGRSIAVTEARHLAPKTQVMVVEALGSRYLLGVTPAGVTLLDKVPADRPEARS